MLIDFKNHLQKDFFLQKTEDVAKNLLGKLLVKLEVNGEILAGEIVETEAYLSSNDFSSHSAPGKTKRNSPMFGEGGILYVYKIYGIHHCINFVTEMEGLGAAVLIRALKPILGIDFMKRQRNNPGDKNLCRGPANLAKALSFTTNDNNRLLTEPSLFIQDNENIEEENITITKRIGITKSADLHLRYYISDSEYVSGKKIR